MRFSDWIKEQIDHLRSMIVADEPPPIPPDGVLEIPTDEGVKLQFLSNTANLSRARRAVEKFCESTPLDQSARDEIGLVVNEAVANVMRHAYEGAPDRPIEIQLERFKTGIRISLRDWGNGINPADRLHAPKDPLVPGGLGLICLRKLMDDVRFVPQHEGMLLEITRTTPGSKAMHADSHRAADAG